MLAAQRKVFAGRVAWFAPCVPEQYPRAWLEQDGSISAVPIDPTGKQIFRFTTGAEDCEETTQYVRGPESLCGI